MDSTAAATNNLMNAISKAVNQMLLSLRVKIDSIPDTAMAALRIRIAATLLSMGQDTGSRPIMFSFLTHSFLRFSDSLVDIPLSDDYPDTKFR